MHKFRIAIASHAYHIPTINKWAKVQNRTVPDVGPKDHGHIKRACNTIIPHQYYSWKTSIQFTVIRFYIYLMIPSDHP